MAVQISSRNFIIVFILGMVVTSQACRIRDITACMDELSDLEFNEVQDACDAVTSAKNCLQTLLDSGACNADITSTIEANIGTIETIETACNVATGIEAVECTANGIFQCLEPTQSAKAQSEKEIACSMMEIAEPCLEAIQDTCSGKRFVVIAAKTAATAIKTARTFC